MIGTIYLASTLPSPAWNLCDKNIVRISIGNCTKHASYSRQNKGYVCGNNKQLLDEVEHDIMNYQGRGLCYLPKPKAEADNTVTRV